MSDNGSSPATKDDLAKVREDLIDALGRQREDLLEAAGKQREDLLEAIHDSETRLLKAFYAYAESAGKHFKDLDQSDITLRQRMAIYEDRLLAVEKRLNLPPGS